MKKAHWNQPRWYYDSNNLKSPIGEVCRDCGITANILTALQRYGQPPYEMAFSVSTFHEGQCDWCGQQRPITQVRDFFYPDFWGLAKARMAFDRRTRKGV